MAYEQGQDMTGMERIKYILSWLAWPGLFALCLLVTGYGFGIGNPVLFFNIAYAFLALSLFALERFMPFERTWNDDDGQTFANIAHTLSSKGTVQTIADLDRATGGNAAVPRPSQS